MGQVGAPQGQDHGQAQAGIAALFDASVAVAATDLNLPQPAPIGGEADHLHRAIEKRQREFRAGRAMARAAMADLGIAPAPLPAGPDRFPAWPEGVTGSISHSDTFCAAAVTKAPLWLGLDVEPATPLQPGLLNAICSPGEAARIAGPDQLLRAKLIFSAKEAAFKAQFPRSRQIFGFDHFDVTLGQGIFRATFTQDVLGFAKGFTLTGRYSTVAEHFVTAVILPQGG